MTTEAQIRKELSRLEKIVAAAWKRHEMNPKREEEQFICPGVGPTACCTNTAVYLADRLNGEVWGYASEDNPEATIGETEGGHDFVILGGRWLVDFWAKDYYQLPDLYNMEDPAQMKKVRKGYGDPAKWIRMSDAALARNVNRMKLEYPEKKGPRDWSPFDE